jgi:hypothetical protein
MKISSNNKKILIFSDPHQELDKVKKIIQAEKADINVCLGDWFDSHFRDDDKDCQNAAAYLKEEFLPSNNNITLFGNHDIHYLFNNRYTICSGYEDRKANIIDKTIGKNKEEFVRKFSWFFYIDEFLCTHAGLHKMFIKPFVYSQEDLYDYLTIQTNEANINIRTNQNHWIYAAGRARGGSQTKGGLVWLDFDSEFSPIEDINQIVGHTHRKQGRIKSYAGTENYCIDTNLNQWITISNGKMETKNYSDL